MKDVTVGVLHIILAAMWRNSEKPHMPACGMDDKRRGRGELDFFADVLPVYYIDGGSSHVAGNPLYSNDTVDGI